MDPRESKGKTDFDSKAQLAEIDISDEQIEEYYRRKREEKDQGKGDLKRKETPPRKPAQEEVEPPLVFDNEDEDGDEDEENKFAGADEDPTRVDYSLFLLSPRNRLRRWCYNISAANPWFDRFILLNIFANCVFLALVDPTGLTEQPFLKKADIYFTIIFTIELVLRVLSKGLIINPGHPRVRKKYGIAYLRDPWNWIDFIVVVTAWPPLFSEFASVSAFRAFRILRPLRTLNVVPFMRFIVTSMLASLPLLLDVVFQMLFLLSMFAILATMLFMGKFHQYCTLGTEPLTTELVEEPVLCGSVQCADEFPSLDPAPVCSINGTTGELFEAPENGFVNFDNFLFSLLTLFTSATLEGWTDVMYMTMDVSQPAAAIFFVVLIVLLSFLTLNLALAVIAESFQTVSKNDTTAANEEFQKRVARNEISNRSLLEKLHVVFREFYAAMSERTEWFTPFQIIIRKIALSSLFDGLINLVVIVNVGLMAAEHYPMKIEISEAFELVNIIFTYIFLAEMVLKLFALGLIEYTSDRMNVFDAIVTIISVVEIIIGSGSISVLRILRLLRIVKLIRSLRSLQILLLKVVSSFFAVLKFLPVLLLCMFIFTILGTQFYGSAYRTTVATEDFPEGSICTSAAKSDTGCPRSNYSTFWNAFLVAFQVLTGENWNASMFDAMEYTSVFASLFYVAEFVVLNFIMLNILLTIMILRFAEPDDEFEAAAARDTGGKKTIREALRDFLSNARAWLTCKADKLPSMPSFDLALDLEVDDVGSFHTARRSFNSSRDFTERVTEFKGNKNKLLGDYTDANEEMNYRSLWMFSGDNTLRKLCHVIAKSKVFEWVIFTCIVGSSISLALYTPQWPRDSTLVQALAILDIVWLGIFTFEAVVKIVALGFVLHPGAYLRDSWNVLDFIIVVSGWIDLLPVQLSFLRSFRALRALRPLRMIKRLEGLRIVFYSLAKATPVCGNVLLIGISIWLLFAIVGVNFFAGTLYSCQCDFVPYGTDTPVIGPESSRTALTAVSRQSFGSSCSPEFIEFLQSQENARQICEENNGTWVAYPANFDNTGRAMLTLFEVATLENWLEVMYATMDAVGIDREPIEDNQEVASVYFLLFILVGSFFVLNLFVSVIADAFTNIKREAEYGTATLLTRAQFEWLEGQRMVLRMRAFRQPLPPRMNAFLAGTRRFFFRMGTSVFFEGFITCAILINTVVLALEHFNMSSGWVLFHDIAGVVFTVIFLLEVIIKLVGLGPRQYFRDPWNDFDFIIVVLTLIPVIFDIRALMNPDAPSFNANFVRMFRILRLLRILRLIKRLKKVRMLFQTLYISLPAIGNVGVMLFLIYFVYAVLGVQLFGTVGILEHPPPNGGGIQRYANFWNFGWALLTLLRCSTGEAWNSIMWDLLFQGGAYQWAWIYFVSFVILGSFVILNLFIAIVLEAFAAVMEHDSFRVKEEHLEQFAHVWARFDPNGDRYIDVARDLKPLLTELPPPLGLGKRAKAGDVIGTMDRLILADGTRLRLDTDGQIGFHELLSALVCRAYRVNGKQLPGNLQRRVEKETRSINRRAKTLSDEEAEMDRNGTAQNYVAATTLQLIARRYLELFDDGPYQQERYQRSNADNHHMNGMVRSSQNPADMNAQTMLVERDKIG